MGPAMYGARRPFIERALAGESVWFPRLISLDRQEQLKPRSCMFRIGIKQDAPWVSTPSLWT